MHLHVTEDVTLGRLSRRRGECLCSKRQASFARPLDPGEFDSLTRCESCFAIADRHGLTFFTDEPWLAVALDTREVA
ncbi:MAG TPA: hypothetical protein VFJ91_00780 [Gaiellaceae bacterium]|nr:hypothetical protein [Gaiellaceae bacterium]